LEFSSSPDIQSDQLFSVPGEWIIVIQPNI
jgi:hypothetical protein